MLNLFLSDSNNAVKLYWKTKKQKIKKIIAEEKAVRIIIFNGMWHLGFYLRTEGNIDDLQFSYADMNFDFSFF